MPASLDVFASETNRTDSATCVSSTVPDHGGGDRLEAFNALAAACVRGPLRTPSRSTSPSYAPDSNLRPRSLASSDRVDPRHAASLGQEVTCTCLQDLAESITQLRNVEKRQSPVRLDTMLHYSPLALSIVMSSLQCGLCSSDIQVLLIASMAMKTIVEWAESFAGCPRESAPLCVKFGGYVCSKEDSDILRLVLTGRALANAREVLSSFQAKIGLVKGEETQARFIHSQIDMLAESLKQTAARFNAAE